MTTDNPVYYQDSLRPLSLAYADPPYPGQAKHWYGDQPTYAGEVDHRDLLERLSGYDGWALSTSAAALQEVLALCPPGVRVGIWEVKNSEHPGNRGRWWWSWEPVILYGWRPTGQVVRNLLSAHSPKGYFGNEIAGQKPAAFCRWVFDLLGAGPGDTLDDLYPGSGAVTQEWDRFLAQPRLGPVELRSKFRHWVKPKGQELGLG